MTAILVLARMLHIGSALLMVSLLFFRWFNLGSDPAGESESDIGLSFFGSLMKWLAAIWVIQILSGAAWFWLVTAEMGGTSLGDALDFHLLKTVFEQTHFGQLWLLRTFLAAGLGLALVVLARDASPSSKGRSVRLGMALVLSGLVLFSLAWAGHAASRAGARGWSIGADILHLGAAAIWPGGLLPLALFLAAAMKMWQPTHGRFTVGVIRRFSRTSLIAVMLLLLSGFINARFLIPSFPDLFASGYGRLLLGKIGLFIGMIGLGAWNRFCILPVFQARAATPADFLRLRRIVLIENALALVILLIVGVMGATSPPPAMP